MLTLLTKCHYSNGSRTIQSIIRAPIKVSSLSVLRQYSGGETYRRSGFAKPVLLILSLTTVGSGGAVVYVRNDPELQKWIKNNIPGGESIVSVVCKELKVEPLDRVAQSFSNVTKSITSIADSLPFISKGEPESTEPLGFEAQKPKSFSAPVPDKPVVYEKRETSAPQGPKQSEVKINDDSVSIQKEQHQGGKESPETVPSTQIKSEELHIEQKSKREVSDSHVNEILRKIEDSEKHVISIANKMTAVLKDYRQSVVQLVEQAVEKDDDELLYTIREKLEEKQDMMSKLEKHAKKTTKKLTKLQHLLENEEVYMDEERRNSLKQLVEEKAKRITDSLSVLNEERSNATVAEEYYNKVIEARKQLSNSLGIVFPQMNVESVLDASDEELELFIIYAYKLVKYYQKEVQKLQALKTAQLNRIYDAFKEGEKNAVKEAVSVELENEKRKLSHEFMKAELRLKTEHEAKLREYLKRQAEVYDDFMAEVVSMKNREMKRKLKCRKDEEIEKIRLNYNVQLAKIISHMKNLEGAIAEREEAEKRAQCSQVLWNACQALMLTMKDGTSTKPWKDQLKPLDSEVNAIIRAAAKGDELVNAVVSSIPEEARYRGVYAETALRDRFLNVEKVAFRLANVPEGYASLVSIFWSYLQSAFIAKLPNPIPAEELKNEPVDMSTFNNYDVLSRARYWIDRGDFMQALQYMNLLKGASRSIAEEWMKEVRIYLETQQAAKTLLFYSVYSSLVYMQKPN